MAIVVAHHHLSKTPKPGAPYPVKPLDCSWFRWRTELGRRRINGPELRERFAYRFVSGIGAVFAAMPSSVIL
jgi:hypothetical protein